MNEPRPICPGCHNEIDPAVCHCGNEKATHGPIADHPFVPMGCDCLRKAVLDAEEEPLVDAQTVATHLKIDRTTVYSLVRGIRGWKTIERLPHHIITDTPMPRMKFKLTEIEAWRERTQFKLKRSGRKKKRLPDVSQIMP